MSGIRPCRDDERTAILGIVNTAAQAYRGLIPADTSVVLARPPLGVQRDG